jgi:hypothetical protein
MSEAESSATVVPLKPAPVKSRAREPSGKRPRAKRPRKRQPAAAQIAAAEPVSLSQVAVQAPERAHAPSRLLALTVFGIGLLTAAVGLYLNASFLWTFGRTSDAGLVLAVVGLVTDTVTLVLPSTVMALWQQSRRGLALAGCCMYAIAVGMTLLTAVGFAATNIDDAVAGRDATATNRGALLDEIDRLKAERRRLVFLPADQSAVAAAQLARDQECGRVGPNCRQRVAELNAVLRDKAASDRATEIDARIAQEEASLGALPALASADPQIEAARAVITWLSGGHLTASAEDIRMSRVVGIAAVLFMAGLLLAFGTALRQPRRA